ncbi:respiratory nitrate reductase subunit delta [Staphylococcus aureus]|nr:respiratory nitrate reductase subunit delta [Staphylococcus aureus]
MINFDNFKKYQESFGYIAQQLCFPEKLTFHPKTFEETISKDHPGYDDLIAFRNVMMTFSLSEIKAIYTDTFDLRKKHHYI